MTDTAEMIRVEQVQVNDIIKTETMGPPMAVLSIGAPGGGQWRSLVLVDVYGQEVCRSMRPGRKVELWDRQ